MKMAAVRILLTCAMLACFQNNICVPVKAVGSGEIGTNSECAKWNTSLSNGLVGEVTPNGTVRGVCGYANMANCLLAVVANPHDRHYNGTEMFLPDQMLDPCNDNTTNVFLHTPQKEHRGKYLVNLHQNGSLYYITEGYIHLERPTQPPPPTGNMSGCNGIGRSNVMIVLAGLAMLNILLE